MHGDIFPLSNVWSVEPRPRKSLARVTRQRVFRRIAHASAASEAVDSLNAAFGVTDPSVASANFCTKPSAVQQQVLDRVYLATASRPDEAFSEKAALQALLRADSLYGGDLGPGSANSLQTYQHGNVSLPHGQSKGADLAHLLTGKQLYNITHVQERMLLSDEELEGEFEKGAPRTYHDPVLKADRKAYMSFIKELYECGVLKLSNWVKVEVEFSLC